MGAIGTAVAQQSLKQVMAFCNSPLMNAVEAYIHFKPEDYGPDGEINNPELESFLRTYMQEFHDFIARVTPSCRPTSSPRWRARHRTPRRVGWFGACCVG